METIQNKEFANPWAEILSEVGPYFMHKMPPEEVILNIKSSHSSYYCIHVPYSPTIIPEFQFIKRPTTWLDLERRR
jgi:hypothetical protein